MFKGDNWHVFWFDNNFNFGFLVDTLKEVFQTVHNYDLAWGLAIHTRFYYLDLISRSQVCQIHKLQIVFRILVHCSWKKCMVITYIKKDKHSMLCVMDVYLKDITIAFSPILHKSVGHQNVCSSCC